jgi:tetratricopeptide (TPR) repeat protein
MYSNMKWIIKLLLAGFAVLVIVSAASAQVRITQSLLPPDEARDIFVAGQRLFDQGRLTDAENRFREVVRRFPKNQIADRADYYLIRALMAQTGKTTEALSLIDSFAKQYPKSSWQNDVLELRIQLTNQVPETFERILISPAPGASPGGRPIFISGRPSPSPAPAPPAPPAPPVAPIGPGSVGPFGIFVGAQSSDPEVSLQQEIMRAMFQSNADRAIEIAMERLKANPGDPVVLASMNMIAQSRSAQAMPMLISIAKSSTNSRARKDAIFWMGQSRTDKDAVVDTLVGLLPSLNEEDSESVAFSLSQIRTDKSINALATIARDKGKNDKARTSAIHWIGQSRVANRVPLLEDIYKNSTDNSKIRTQVAFALSQTREPQAITVLGNMASSDPDIEVRKQAVFWLGQSRSPEAAQQLERLLQKK